jgi:hypothetical protein
MQDAIGALAGMHQAINTLLVGRLAAHDTDASFRAQPSPLARRALATRVRGERAGKHRVCRLP